MIRQLAARTAFSLFRSQLALARPLSRGMANGTAASIGKHGKIILPTRVTVAELSSLLGTISH